jgi:hypothetical protein
MANPVRPGTHKNPTGQLLNQSLAKKENKRRWQTLAAKIGDIIDSLPYQKENVSSDDAPKVGKEEKRTKRLTNAINDSRYIWANSEFKLPIKVVQSELRKFHRNAVRYEYLVDSALMDQTMDTINLILVDDLLSGSESWTNRFWLDTFVNASIQDGTIDSFNSMQNIVSGTVLEPNIAILNAQQQLNTPAYTERLRRVHGRVFEGMNGLTSEMKSQLRFTLTEGMARGVGIRDLKGMVYKRLGVGMARSERIARTEINKAYRDSYIDESEELGEMIEEDTGFTAMQVHRSALSPTTRRSHAARHGNMYTAQQMKDWWAKNGNSINCLCSTLTVLVNKKTGQVLQQKMLDTMEKQKKQWFPSK